MPYKNRICLTLFHRLSSFIENNSVVFTFFRARFFIFFRYVIYLNLLISITCTTVSVVMFR